MEKEIIITLIFIMAVGPLLLYMLYKMVKTAKNIA
jgi:hypothetical protein